MLPKPLPLRPKHGVRPSRISSASAPDGLRPRVFSRDYLQEFYQDEQEPLAAITSTVETGLHAFACFEVQEHAGHCRQGKLRGQSLQ